MDFKKFLEMSADANTPETTAVINESTVVATANTGKKSLKEYFEAVEKNLLNELTSQPAQVPVIGQDGTQMGTLKIANDQTPAAQALNRAINDIVKGTSGAGMQVVLPKKAAAPVGQTSQTTPGQAVQMGPAITGSSTAMKEEQMDEKWAGDAEVKATGQYSGKTVEELKSMLAKLKKSGPHKEGTPANKRMKQIMFAIRAKKGWKGGVEEAQLDEKAQNPYAVGMAVAKKAAGITKKHATDLPKSVVVKGHEIAKKIKKKEQTDEAEIPKSGPDYGAGLGAGRSATTLESQKVTESMNTLEAAYHEGKSHGLSKHGYACRYNEGSEEHRRYHEGFKEGLDECYGLQPNRGLVVGEESGQDVVDSMASYGAEEGALDEMDKTAYMQHKARTTPGDTFKAFGQTMHDKDVLEADAFAFESLEQKLNSLLNEDAEPVAEGVNVSMSQGQGGMHGDKLDDSVSVSATGDDAAKLLAFIKQVGIGGLGGGEAHDAEVHTDAHPIAAIASDYGAPKFAGHDDMKSLLAKVTGGEEDEAHACNECGMMETDCGCDKEVVDEVETPDQETDEMAESDGEGDIAAYGQEAEINASMPAKGGATNEDGAEALGSNVVGQSEQDDAEEVNEESTAEKDDKAERAGEKVKKDIEYDDKKDKLDEWANEAGKDGTEAAFERDIEFMTKVIAGGLNKPKSTGQTTIPVIAHQDARTGDEDVAAWKKLAGLGK